MNNLIDLIVLAFILLVGLFVLLIWALIVLAVFRTSTDQNSWRGDPYKAFIALLFSPGILFGHIAFWLIQKLWRLTRLVLMIGLILLAIFLSPAFLLAIPLVFLVFKLLQAAAPLGSRIFNLSLDFFDQLDFWFGSQRQARLS